MTRRILFACTAAALLGGCETALEVGTRKARVADGGGGSGGIDAAAGRGGMDARAPVDAAVDAARPEVTPDLPQERPPDTLPRDTGAPDLGALSMSYFPLARGFYWTYRVTPPVGAPFTKIQEVEEPARVGGEGLERNKVVFRLRTQKKSGVEEPAADKTLTWQMWEGDSLVRYREQSFIRGTDTPNLDEWWQPPRLRLDVAPDRMKAMASWVEPFFEIKQVPGFPAAMPIQRMRTWTVMSLDAMVTVPKGTFRCLHVRVTSSTGRFKDYWFARGVGKVKETGTQTEELLDFNTQTVTPAKP